ncbi:CRISPR-associated DxTHG motif protein [Blautia sp. AM46-5]|nr:CRISPR-associated DxTHG motif protein [Blautia sp. AF22-5LB]RHS53329.1 CRISPR-associated DxTHG motif protein [Blautia sp. AM46-5]RHS59329.1 CRISPR-associated DxTHG motif protein [Blautia sp. AM46-3MH]RHU48548.1 CRISPR-associated DxTHG motif protein [Blautia sp. TF11-31AT]
MHTAAYKVDITSGLRFIPVVAY